MKLRILLLLTVAPAFAKVTITAETAVLVDDREPVALKKAAADLASDLGKVFGKPVRVARQPGEAAPATIVVSLTHNLPAAVQRPPGLEVLRIVTVKDPWAGSPVRDAVVLTGSDLRGAIYSVYHFSQTYLGVDPFWFWTDHEPARRSSVVLPDATAVTEGPPSFRYRGWFINDEDLLTFWKPGNEDGTGIALEAWDEVFEAILRLKGNMIVPGTFIFPDEPQARAAAERGLIITQHHIEVVGTNTYRWPEDKPYSFASHPKLLLAAWAQAVGEYLPDQEVIWTVGYRGRHDRPFWSDDQSAASTDAERAALIRRAIDEQIRIVRRTRKAPYFLMNAWMESVPFLRNGLLALPGGVTLVWPDNGHGIIRDEGTIAKSQGVYYHTAMYNSRANQLTEMVALERIQRELGRAAAAGATQYLLINTSDIRPVTMTTRAVMELAWNAGPWAAGGGGQAGAYLAKWCREEFGPKAGPLLESYYRAYFEAPGRYGQAEEETLADNAYHTFARGLLVDLIKEQHTIPPRFFSHIKEYGEFAGLLVKAAREAEPRWRKARAAAEQAAPLIPSPRRQFFQWHVRTQLDIHEHSNRMLALVAEAVRETTPEARLKEITAAMEETRAVLKSLAAAEYGAWSGFFKRDLFVNVRHTLALLQACQAKLAGRPVPVEIPIAVRPEDPYVALKAYQGKRRLRM